jgi:hypothetical protein
MSKGRARAVSAIALLVLLLPLVPVGAAAVLRHLSNYPTDDLSLGRGPGGTGDQSDHTRPPPEAFGPGHVANTDFRAHAQATPALREAGAPLEARIALVLADLETRTAVDEALVRAALLPVAGAEGLLVSDNAAPGNGIGFAVDIQADGVPGCVWGWVSAGESVLLTSGTTTGEGCLPLLY